MSAIEMQKHLSNKIIFNRTNLIKFDESLSHDSLPSFWSSKQTYESILYDKYFIEQAC